MSRTDHIVGRFQTTMGDSWWWRRYADLVDRKNPDGTYKAFDGKAARQLMMTRRNRCKYAEQIAKGLPIEHKLPYRARPANQLDTVVPMIERPEGMTRQTQRRLYREACKLAGVPPTGKPRDVPDFMKLMGYKKLPKSWRGMPEWQRKGEEEKLWQEFRAKYVQISEAPLPGLEGVTTLGEP